jgi:hypothetical protein
VPIVRRAFGEILELTDEFAKDAEFAYLNPGRVRFGSDWDKLPAGTLLSKTQVASMLGISSKDVTKWLDFNQVSSFKLDGKLVCCKGDVERAVRNRMGSLEVQVGEARIPLHKFLAVVPINFFHSRKANLKGSATLVVDQNMSDFLVGRGTTERAKSIFERLGCRLESGEIVQIRTHQFRHFLDTAAATGGLPELVRARWMGRKDVSQNSAYDHESGISLAKKIRLRLVEGGLIGPIADRASESADLAARESVADDYVRAVHKTMLGRCFHDWASSPCPEHEGCWGCDEHLLIKGNPLEVAEAERQLSETTSALSVAEAERTDETFGANNWVLSHVRKRDQLERILKTHRDPEIPDGTVVHLSNRLADGSGAS